MPFSLTDARQRRRDATRGEGQVSAQVAAALSRRRARGIRHEVALDVVMLVFASLAATLSASASGGEPASLSGTLAFVVMVLVAIGLSGVYRPRFVVHFLDDARSVLGATAIAAMSITFARVLFTDDPDIAAQQARVWLFAATYLIAGRAGYQLVETRARRRGEVAQPTLVVGAGRVGRLIAARLLERPEFGLRPVAFFDDDPLDSGPELGADIPVFGSGASESSNGTGFADGVELAIQDLDIRHVIMTFSLASHDMELSLVRRCQEMGVSVSLVPRLFEGVPDQTSLERLGGIPLISVYPRDPRGWQFAIKYGIDRVLALLALVLLLPVFLFAAIGTLLTLGRPLLFRQDRTGIDGHRFDILKFRTMRGGTGSPDPRLAEDLERGIAPGGVEGEDRRTRFGKLLRSTSIDELPQLLNVLRGDMSLIGPRPERPEFVDRFGGEIHRYRDRLRVKSGITGWAQVHGLRGRTSISDRVEWDNYYIENWSLWLDLKTVLLTVRAVFRDRSD